jgi:CheY-like chemotaxis protein
MEKIKIILADRDMDTRIFFSEVFNSLKVPNTYTMYDSRAQLIEYLNSTSEPPNLIFLNTDQYNVNGLECLRLIRKDPKFSDTCVAVYANRSTEDKLTDIFIAGANIYIERPGETEHFEKIISQVISINWQYIVDGLDREKFMLKY